MTLGSCHTEIGILSVSQNISLNIDRFVSKFTFYHFLRDASYILPGPGSTRQKNFGIDEI